MKYVVLALVLGSIAMTLATPVEAGDDADAKIAKLEAENKKLREEAAQHDHELRMADERAAYAMGQLAQLERSMRIELREAQRAADFEAKRRAEENATHAMYYGVLLKRVGPRVIAPLAEQLREAPVRHAPRIAPILGLFGAEAAPVIPILEVIAADETHQRRGVARYAEEALDSIRAAMRLKALDEQAK